MDHVHYNIYLVYINLRYVMSPSMKVYLDAVNFVEKILDLQNNTSFDLIKR